MYCQGEQSSGGEAATGESQSEPSQTHSGSGKQPVWVYVRMDNRGSGPRYEALLAALQCCVSLAPPPLFNNSSISSYSDTEGIYLGVCDVSVCVSNSLPTEKKLCLCEIRFHTFPDESSLLFCFPGGKTERNSGNLGRIKPIITSS